MNGKGVRVLGLRSPPPGAGPGRAHLLPLALLGALVLAGSGCGRGSRATPGVESGPRPEATARSQELTDHLQRLEAENQELRRRLEGASARQPPERPAVSPAKPGLPVPPARERPVVTPPAKPTPEVESPPRQASESPPTPPPPADNPTFARPASPGGLRAEVVLATGKTLQYAEADGEDLGDFKGKGFTQRCVRVIHPDSPLTVFFRPDRKQDRVEVVFELGRCWGKANQAAANLGAYKVRIFRQDKVLAQVDVAKHWWFSRWRWQSAPRPLVRTRDEAQAVLGLPPFDPQLLKYCLPSRAVQYAGPMDNAGVAKKMAMGGDRGDIGIITEWQADYLATGSPTALASLRAQAEAAGSVPWHMRDEITAAPVNLFKHPTALWHKQRPREAENVWFTETDWGPDGSHQPALAFVPYVLTGDPYYLEEMQCQLTYAIGWAWATRMRAKMPAQFFPGETRAFAWSLRTGAELAAITPEVTPNWLLPRAYWQRVLESNREYFEKVFVNDPKPASAVFRAATRQDMVASWMEDYLILAMSHAVLLGHTEWRKALTWKAGSAIALADGKSGWPAQWCTPYYYNVMDAKGKHYSTWAEAWEAFKANPKNKVPDPLPSWPQWAQNNWWGYSYQSLGALAGAAKAGVEGADHACENVRQITLDGLQRKRGAMLYRWAFTPKTSR